MTKLLSQPLTLANGALLPNRIAKAAMSERLCAPGGAPSQELVNLYERWSRGGTGLLITGNVMIEARALGEAGNVVLEDDTHLEAFKIWARATGETQVWMQLNHPGRQSPRNISRQPVAPSAVPMKGMGGLFAAPRELEAAEIEAIIERFATSAALAEAAGFNGVQIHGAHGYLISQFLSPRTNLRTDDWGGSDEKRRRFVLEVVRAIREAVGADFAIGLKLNSADFQRGGFTEEASMAVVEALAGEGSIDLLEISGGTYERSAMFAEPHKSDRTQAREAFFQAYAEKVRAATPNMPLMVTGGFRTARGMERALESGAVDVVGMARPLAAEPDLPSRLISGKSEAAQPIRLATGIKKLDAAIQGVWYQAQIERMGRGLAPKPRLSRLRAMAGYFYAAKRHAVESKEPGATTRSRVQATGVV